MFAAYNARHSLHCKVNAVAHRRVAPPVEHKAVEEGRSGEIAFGRLKLTPKPALRYLTPSDFENPNRLSGILTANFRQLAHAQYVCESGSCGMEKWCARRLSPYGSPVNLTPVSTPMYAPTLRGVKGSDTVRSSLINTLNSNFQRFANAIAQLTKFPKPGVPEGGSANSEEMSQLIDKAARGRASRYGVGVVPVYEPFDHALFDHPGDALGIEDLWKWYTEVMAGHGLLAYGGFYITAAPGLAERRGGAPAYVVSAVVSEPLPELGKFGA